MEMKREATQQNEQERECSNKAFEGAVEDKQTRIRVTTKRAYTIFGGLNSTSIFSIIQL